MTDRHDVIVIGAGHNGLVCAGFLARKGLKVVVLEAGSAPGGMAAMRQLGADYRVPGLAHCAYPVDKDIRKALQLDNYGYSPGEPANTISLCSNGEHITLLQQESHGVSDDDARAYQQFKSEYLAFAAALKPLFASAAPRLKDMPSKDKFTLAKLGWNLRFGLGKDSMYEFLRVAAINIQDVLDERFDNDLLKGAIALDAVLGGAMGPRTPGTVLTWLQRISGELNGPLSCSAAGSLVAALVDSASAAGVEIRCGSRVQQILVEDDKAVGAVLASGETLAAAHVVSNADPRVTFGELVGAPALDAMFAHRVSQIRGNGVVARLNLALKALPEFTGLTVDDLQHRLLIAPSSRYVEQAFNHSKYGEVSSSPVFEITLPSLHDDTLAPDGHHILSANVAFLPCDLVGGWATHNAGIKAQLIEHLERYAPDLRSILVDSELITPNDIENDYGAVNGHWHHGELSIHQSFMMRPVYGAAQYATPIDNLYLCGAGSHPGGGISGRPGRNAALRVLNGAGSR